ncbi:hypothetical protein OSB04_015270 [Centaurea solstitialis]|uniref:WEB family protein n=1 Tax=Centaurea solstitialis TaxID=347529 RepID=A0AA38WGD7_9ASTR|nr:hypothetical protein OSB04_015270 [Centaurea solstitialis]
MVAKDRQSKTDSPKVEVGEIDTRAPFQSSRMPSIFSAKVLFRRVLVNETKLHLAQKELDKLKERLKIAETTKTGALTELERAKRTVEDLTKKLEVINAAKEATIKATEAAKDQVKHLDGGQTSSNGVLMRDSENVKEQYAAVFTELDAAKQELRRIRHDRESAMDEKSAAIGMVAEAEVTGKANADRAGEISKEIMSVQEAIEHVKMATVEARKEQEKIYAEKNVQKLAHKAALEESAKKLLALRAEIDPETSEILETRFAETTSEIKRLRAEMENARAADLDSLKNVTSELDFAKESLTKVAEEEGSLKSMLESLKIELENVKKEHEELKSKEAETETLVGNLNDKLRKSKVELEGAVLEEAKVSGALDEMAVALRQLMTESENAKRETEEMRSEAEELKKEAAAIGTELEAAESKLRVALREAEEAKSAESKALEEIKVISERTDAARASTSGSGSKITISREEFESLSRKVEESEKLAAMKVEAAAAQAEAEIEETRAAAEAALKRAETADAARRAVEGELRRWREKEQKKAAEAASLILQETEMQTPLSLPSTPIHKMQNPGPKAKPKTKKVLVSNLSSLFQRKKSQVDGGGSSPSYLPGEKPM